MPQQFAAVVTRSASGWRGHDFDVTEHADLDELVEALRDLADDEGMALLFLEEDDEWFAIVRVEGSKDPRTFISDDRAVISSAVAAMIMEDIIPPEESDDDEESIKPEPEVFGDTNILADLGTSEDTLLELCAEEGMLPADIVTACCEKAGCADALDALRIA